LAMHSSLSERLTPELTGPPPTAWQWKNPGSRRLRLNGLLIESCFKQAGNHAVDRAPSAWLTEHPFQTG
jgi:hypothetical protein